MSPLLSIGQRSEHVETEVEEQVGYHNSCYVQPEPVEQAIADDWIVLEGLVPGKHLDQGQREAG